MNKHDACIIMSNEITNDVTFFMFFTLISLLSIIIIIIVAGVRTECRYDIDCIENAFCFHQYVCRCKNELDGWKDEFNCPGENFT